MSNRIGQNAVESFQSLMQGLESRVMLSGNVSASVVDGDLVIRGNSGSNAIVLDQTGLTDTQVRISSGSSATTINRDAGPLVLDGVTRLRVALGAGNDSILWNDVVLGRGATIDGGDGRNAVKLSGGTIQKGLIVSNASAVTLRKLTIGGTVKITGQDRDDTVKIDDSALHALTISTGAGDDLVRIENSGASDGVRSTFNGDVSISLGDDDDNLRVGIKGETGNQAEFEAGVRFNGGARRDTLVYSGVGGLADGSVTNFELINPKFGVNLRSAAAFAVLAGSGVSNTGGTNVTGDLGSSPTGTVTGSPTVDGEIHNANPTADQAKLDLTTAYNDAKGRAGTPTIALPAELSGLTLAPGIYKNASSVSLSSAQVTLDAKGDANAVFIFQIGSTLTTISGTGIILAGGAKAANIYWQVGSSATLGTNSTFKGTIMADQSITLKSGAALQGRALARIGAVVLDSNIVTMPA